MDPNTVLDAIIEAAVNGESQNLTDAAEDLAAWLDRGGFAPKDPRPEGRAVNPVYVYLSRSDAMYESGAVPRDVLWEVPLGPFEFFQTTYETLRFGDEEILGHLGKDGYWHVEGHEYPFSDVTVNTIKSGRA